MKRLLLFAAAVYAGCFAVTFADDYAKGRENAEKAREVKSSPAKQATKPISPTVAAEKTYRRRSASELRKRRARIASDINERVMESEAARLGANADRHAQDQLAQAAFLAAQQQAAVQAQAQQAAQQQAFANALLWQMANQPFYNQGPFYETVQHTGNQTWINGYGPYGPFNETITHAGSQTFVNGSGVPIGPWAGGYGWGW